MNKRIAIRWICFFILCSSIVQISCSKSKEIKFQLVSNGNLIFEILPKDIIFYDTSQIRSGMGIHEMRLRPNFYQKDSFILNPPLYLNCYIDDEEYFWSEFYHRKQSENRLWINFKFRNLCKNYWTFQEQNIGELILRTKNECNSIEFFHSKQKMYYSRERYYKKKQYFKNYIDTARLAHEILYDEYFLNALRENNIEIK